MNSCLTGVASTSRACIRTVRRPAVMTVPILRLVCFIVYSCGKCVVCSVYCNAFEAEVARNKLTFMSAG